MSRLIAPAALLVALLSLALNLVLFVRLNTARSAALATLDRTSARLDQLGDVTVRQTFKVNQALSVAGDLPLNQEFNVPISTTIPVKTTAHVNVSTPLGPLDVPVSIDTSVPVNLQVPVAISRTVPYSLAVPLDLQVPVEIRLRDLGIDGAVQEARQELDRLRTSLE